MSDLLSMVIYHRKELERILAGRFCINQEFLTQLRGAHWKPELDREVVRVWGFVCTLPPMDNDSYLERVIKWTFNNRLECQLIGWMIADSNRTIEYYLSGPSFPESLFVWAMDGYKKLSYLQASLSFLTSMVKD